MKSTPHSDIPTRFVPHGVDAGSWLGFEQRVQDRRFAALLDTVRGALAAHDCDAARDALTEARAIRPNADELIELEHKLETQSLAERRRMPGAAALLVAGVALLLVVDALRAPRAQPDEPAPAPAPIEAQTFAAPAPAPVATAGLAGDAVAAIAIEVEEPVRSSASVPESADTAPAAPAPPVTPPPIQLAAAPALARVRPPVVAEVPAPVATVPAPITQPRPNPAAAAAVLAPAPAETAPAVLAAGVVPARSDERLVESALQRYARAYSALDARAARQVWPSVDERALSNAFAGLREQSLDFQECEVVVQQSAADAICRGTARYVTVVGNSSPRVEPRTWHFELSRQGEEWLINAAVARR